MKRPRKPLRFSWSSTAKFVKAQKFLRSAYSICRGRCRSQPFATKERYGCGSAACRYTSTRQNTSFYTKNSGKFGTSQWADRVVGPCNDPRSPLLGRTSLSARRMYRFYGNLRRIRDFPAGRCGHRPLQPNAQVHTNPPRIFDDSVPSAGRSRAPPLPRLWANSYCHANFERRAFLPQLFKRSYPQIRCTVTGGAQSSARKVTWCVRNSYKSGLT